ncbi:MAG: nitrate reductase [Desulfobacteraceae bacterium]|nr:nitrate reductase [Desulfobacteraceae bacterium]
MIHTLYKLLSGPMMWLAVILFCAGTLYRLWTIFRLVRRKEKFICSYLSLRYSLRSLVHWLTPFASLNMRLNPVMTVVSFAFHICLLFVPLFLLAHIVLWEQAWGIHWWALPDLVADIMSLVVPAACIYFAIRRIRKPEVRYVTGVGDYLLLGLIALPFVTGFYCRMQWPGYGPVMLVHMFSGQVLLATLPFTRLSHMVLMWFTRSYMGSEFGAVRHARDY